MGALLASCIVPCANDIFEGQQVQNPNDSSVDEYSRPPSVTSSRSNNSAVKLQPAQAPAKLGSNV
jgi:hypothetical protein